MLNRAIVSAALLWMACGFAWCQPARQELLGWDELEARITGKKVALVLPDGTRIQGKPIAVTPDGMRVKVTKTSSREVLPKGERVVVRKDVSVLQVTTYRKSGRWIGTVGAMGAATGAILSQQIDLYEGAMTVVVPVVAAVGVIGAGVAGYFIGKRIDRTVTEIHVRP